MVRSKKQRKRRQREQQTTSYLSAHSSQDEDQLLQSVLAASAAEAGVSLDTPPSPSISPLSPTAAPFVASHAQVTLNASVDSFALPEVAVNEGRSTLVRSSPMPVRPYRKEPGTSLTSLLNFSFAPRELESEHSTSASPPAPSFSRNRKVSRYSKDRFRNATYRFAVTSAKEALYGTRQELCASLPHHGPDRCSDGVTLHGQPAHSLSCVDTAVPWEQVALVYHSDNEAFVCSICLQSAVAPRMTTCGHVFCLPCLLHYFFVSDTEDKWKKCPVCFEPCACDPAHIRPVALSHHAEYAVGGAVTFTLVQRPSHSSVVLPRRHLPEWRRRGGGLPPAAHPMAAFSRLSRVADADAAPVLRAHAAADAAQIAEALAVAVAERDPHSVRFFEMAQHRIAATYPEVFQGGVGTGALIDSVEEATSGLEQQQQQQQQQQRSQVDGVEAEKGVPEPEPGPQEEDTPEAESSGDGSSSPQDTHTFYQEENAQYVFMESISFRMLLAEFHDVSHFPETLTAPILALRHVVVDEQFRRRHRFLAHIPLTSHIRLATLDLAGVVGAAVLKRFKSQLPDPVAEKRRQREAERREEERRHRERSQPIVTGSAFPSLHASCGGVVDGRGGEEASSGEEAERRDGAGVDGSVWSECDSGEDGESGEEHGVEVEGAQEERSSPAAPTFRDVLLNPSRRVHGDPSSFLCAEPAAVRVAEKKGRKKQKKTVWMCNSSARGYKA